MEDSHYFLTNPARIIYEKSRINFMAYEIYFVSLPAVDLCIF